MGMTTLTALLMVLTAFLHCSISSFLSLSLLDRVQNSIKILRSSSLHMFGAIL
jgi:hypothetical protein